MAERQTFYHEPVSNIPTPELGLLRSPQSQRSRARSARASPRSYHQRSPNPPNPSPIPDNLYDLNRDAFSVDPEPPFLQVGGEMPDQYQQQQQYDQSDGNRFVGGFVVGLKKAWRGYRGAGRKRQQHVEEGSLSSPTYSQPTPTNAAANLSHHHPQPPQASSPSMTSSTSDTIHGVTEDTHDGTTAVSHEVLPPPLPIGSPISIEPQLAPDYAKMPTPPPSDASFGVYMSRVQRFFHRINSLPWVANERVTVDYIPPRREPKRIPRTRPVTRSSNRAVFSWYNNQHHQAASLDLLSSLTSSPTGAGYPPYEGRTIPVVAYNANATFAGAPMYPGGYAQYQPFAPTNYPQSYMVQTQPVYITASGAPFPPPPP
ncbi:hypothetical protein BD779DRAFT_1543527 [Infundibulicybe gibba]|nr:hypothetical protein BD779DRAFT_1543527 [Infundibulicybe gibba]